jgi:thioredoxin 2
VVAAAPHLGTIPPDLEKDVTAPGDTLLVACPHCHTLNRVPQARLAQQPVCGRCKETLFGNGPFALDQASFDIHATRAELPLLVDFWAPWCSPCLQMAPAYADAARQLEPQFHVAKVDTEAEQGLGARFNIRSIPTLAVFHRGREIARIMGARPAREIVAWARQSLGS